MTLLADERSSWGGTAEPGQGVGVSVETGWSGKNREAELMRNEFRSQETRWMRDHKHRLLGQEDALDDLEFILTKTRAHPSTRGGDNRIIDDAFDQVFYAGRF